MSAPAGIDPRQVSLITAHSLRHSMRSGSGLVFVLLALFFGLIAAQAVISPVEALATQGANFGITGGNAEVEKQIVALARPVVTWALSPPESDDPDAQRRADVRTERWVNFVLDDRPALLSAILFIMVFGMPLLLGFGAFNQTAGDIGSKGLRYHLLRADRSTIFYGRLIATTILTVAVQALVILTIALYLGLKVQIYDGMAIATWSLQGLVALCFLSVPYVAVCAWISAGNDSPMVSLVLCKLIIGGVVLLAMIGQFFWEPLRYVNYLLPWGVQNYLLAPGFTTVALTAAACVGYTAVFAWLGARKFQTRDL